MLEARTVKMVEVQDWDDLVEKTYGRTYKFQQQNGCQGRGTREITIPDESEAYDYDGREIVPEIVNGPQMGVSFAAWLARDPKQKLESKGDEDSFSLGLWWRRNFYPDLQTVANDLHAKGLVEAGDYVINIDWRLCD